MKIANTDAEIMSCFDVMQQLRTQLVRDDWVSIIRAMQDEHYQLAYLETAGRVVAVAGFYLCYKLAANGRSLYVYDLVTDDSQRSEGFGTQLMDDLKELARAEGCTTIELDSGVHRFDAHRFYLRERYQIASHHFVCPLK